MAGWHIGVIGGSGLYEAGVLADVQEIPVASAFGNPSASVTMGVIEGVRFTFLARHGAGHRLPPSHVNYRANIDVLKRCGVTDVLAISAVGSLREELAPGDVCRGRPVHRPDGRPRRGASSATASWPMSGSPIRSARGSSVMPPRRPKPADAPVRIAAAATSLSKGRSFRPAPKANSIASGVPT